MKKSHKPIKPIDPFQVFNHGIRFLGTDQYLRFSTGGPSSPWAQTIVTPTLVLSAFAAELFLKCLLLIEGQKVEPIHRLDILFRRLSHKRKRRIEEMWNADARAKLEPIRTMKNVPTDLPNALVKCGKAFDQLRYFYEDPESVIYYIGDFAWVLMRAIVEIKPEWAPPEPPPIRPTSQAR
jgi:hypothetical protein